MNRLKYIRQTITSLICLIFASCSEQPTKEDFFMFPITEIHDIKEQILSLSRIEDPGADMDCCSIKDSLLFSFDGGKKYGFSITNINNGDLIGQYCARGRSWKEPLSLLPIFEFYEENDSLMTVLFSYLDHKVFFWNITASLRDGKDHYRKITKIAPDRSRTLPLLSFYLLDSSRLIVYNSEQIAEINEMVKVPAYEIYDTDKGALLRKFDLFNFVEYHTGDPYYSSKSFLSCTDCIKPDRTKIAFAMAHFPQINILDINTGNVTGFSIKDAMQFSAKENIYHFSSIKADDNYIYTLFFGKPFDMTNYDSVPDILYVLDWQGNIIKKFRLEYHFTTLNLDNGRLYFSHNARGGLYFIDVDKLVTN